MMKNQLKYDLRGVSANKSEVHDAIKHLDKGLYPTAFCKILPDIIVGDKDYCNIIHADTAGTKTALAYMYYKETGDLSVWKGIAQDAIVMNLDDMAAVGCLENIVLSSTIGRNKHLIPGEVIQTIINSTIEFIDLMQGHGVNIKSGGGETADVGDIVRTIDVGYTAFARMKRSDLIVNDVKAGNVIVGLASYGKSTYESEYNGGMGSNGLTSARHDVFDKIYREKYPETYAPSTPIEVVFSGTKKLTDIIDVNGESITAGKLVLSPTRTFAPVLKSIISNYKGQINGLIHNTGGAQTKVLKFVENKKIIKNNLFEIPPLFKMIQEESGTSYEEMFQVFNMGNRLEFYVDESIAQGIIDISKSFNIDAQIIGYVEDSSKNELVIDRKGERFTYN